MAVDGHNGTGHDGSGRDGSGRDRSLDIAKGIAMVAIVLGHVLRGLSAADLAPRTSEWFLETDDALYSFHLAVFAVLAGTFLRPGVEKRGIAAYLRPRVTLLVYLYLLWTVIQGAFKVVVGNLVNSPLPLDRFLTSFATAEGQMWWLAFLAAVTVAGAVTRPWVSRTRAALSSLVVAVISLLAWGWTGPWVFMEGISLAAFFWAGMLLGRRGLEPVTRGSGAALAAGLGLGFGGALLALTDPMPPSSWIGPRTASAIALGVVTSVALSLGVLGVAGLLRRSALARPLGFVGQHSLEIFLAHIIATAGTRIALDRLGVETLWVQVPAGVAVGVLLPLGLWWVGRRIGFPWLFASPVKEPRQDS